MKKIISLLLCLSLLFTNVCFAANKVSTSTEKVLISETNYANGFNKIYQQGNNYIQEGVMFGTQYLMKLPSNMEKDYLEYSLTQFDEIGNAEYTVTFNENKQIVQYNHKTGETTIPEQDGTFIYYAPGEEPNNLKFPDRITNKKDDKLKINSDDSISIMAIGSPYYSDQLYSYEITPVGSQLVYRSVAQDSSWVQIGNDVTVGTFYFESLSTLAFVITTFLSILGSFIGQTWPSPNVMALKLAAIGIAISGGATIYSSYIQASADQFSETHRVTVRYNNSSGSIYEVTDAYKFYRDVWMSNNAGEQWTQIEDNIQYGGVVGGGYEVCQSVHAGGDAQ